MFVEGAHIECNSSSPSITKAFNNIYTCINNDNCSSSLSSKMKKNKIKCVNFQQLQRVERMRFEIELFFMYIYRKKHTRLSLVDSL